MPAGSTPISVTSWNRIAEEDATHLLVVDTRRIYRVEHDQHGHLLSYTPVFSNDVIAANPFLDHVSSVSVINDPGGGVQIWIGCGAKLYSWVDREPHSQVRPKQPTLQEWGTAQGLGEDTWQSVLRDRSGALWAGGMKRVQVLLPGAARFTDRSIPGSNPGSTYSYAPLREDREGRIVVPSDDGVARWNAGHWQLVDRANGLAINGHVTNLIFDNTGDLWVGTHGNGMINWTGYEGWEGWTDAQKLPSPVVWAVASSPTGRVFAGTDRGPAWVEPATGSSGSLYGSHKWDFGQVNSLGLNPDGSLWSGTFSGNLLQLDSKTGTVRQKAKLPVSIMRGLTDSHGNVFFSTTLGIYERKAGDALGATRKVTDADPLLTESTRVDAACEAPDGTLWFMSLKRLLRFKSGQWTKPPIDKLPALPGRTIDMACAPDGSIWITGQQTGTWRLAYANARLSASPLPLPQERSSEVPVAVAVDSRGWVWLGSDSGLLVWNGKSWRHLTQESGLIWNDVNRGALKFAPDGSLWIGTSGGLSHLLHPESVFNPLSMAIQIKRIIRGDLHISPESAVTLPWSPQPLNFQISTAAIHNASETLISARMLGLQTDWSSNRTGAFQYNNLPPGKYTFQTKVANSAFDAASNVLSLQITILPPWWRSNWFYFLCALALIALILVVDRLRVRHLRERSRKFELLVHERTQELEESREQLRILAALDGLTGMLNRIAIMKSLAAEMHRANREGTILVVAMVDLDHFKRINDLYGHLAGDEAIRTFASAVCNAMRSYDHAGRYGGEEFLLVLANIPYEAVERSLARLHKAITNLEVHYGDFNFTFTCSVGAVIFDPAQGVKKPDSLLTIADAALYRAKAAGRNRVVIGTDPALADSGVSSSPLDSEQQPL